MLSTVLLSNGLVVPVSERRKQVLHFSRGPGTLQYIPPFISQNLVAIISPILQMKRMRLGGVKYFSKGHFVIYTVDLGFKLRPSDQGSALFVHTVIRLWLCRRQSLPLCSSHSVGRIHFSFLKLYLPESKRPSCSWCRVKQPPGLWSPSGQLSTQRP